jgi:hypothetical protein
MAAAFASEHEPATETARIWQPRVVQAFARTSIGAAGSPASVMQIVTSVPHHGVVSSFTIVPSTFVPSR